jgi:hypothetical protein
MDNTIPPKYTTYQLHQFLIKLNKRLRSVDQSANISVIEQHEYPVESVIVDNEHREVVMKVVVTGSVLGRQELKFFFDKEGDFSYVGDGVDIKVNKLN